jgi:hypothetical protein
MAALDKLIDLLEQIKQTDPDFTDKASRAIDALIGAPSEASSSPPPPPPEPEASYQDYAEISKTHLKEIQDEQKALNQKITELGLLQQNYEADKEVLLEYIEQKQKYLREYLLSLKEVYRLDPEARYLLTFPEKEGEKATFVRRDS